MRGRKQIAIVILHKFIYEEIDNPRMRGRKPGEAYFTVAPVVEEIDNPRMRGRKRTGDLVPKRLSRRRN